MNLPSVARFLLAASFTLFLSNQHLLAQEGATIGTANGPTNGPTNGLTNGDMESTDEDGGLTDWSFIARPDNAASLSTVSEDVQEGSSAALISAASNNQFANLMQAFDATPFRGQRIRFRALVRTADLDLSARVQLWFRVDRETESGERKLGEFDNMMDRPIKSSDWQPFEVVLNVADDALRLNVGMFVQGGGGKAWIDGATLDAVDEEVASTAMSMPDGNVAKTAPTQPFFNHWLWLALATLVLFVASQFGRWQIAEFPHERMRLDGLLGGFRRFAFRFTFVYWLLYFLPSPFSSLIPAKFRTQSIGWYTDSMDRLVRWSAEKVIGIENELVAPNGSGDTTYAYVSLLVGFSLAMTIAVLWTIIDRRRTDYRIANDLLRSFLRYILAITMIGYGLAKVGWLPGQFPSPGEFQLGRTYGESSPMGLIWTLMGTSLAYTNFAGIGEVLGGLLLVFRRTTSLGALIVFGVMLNVMLLNFCYDVPVKQYSTHLWVGAIFLLIPDVRRLLSVLLFNRSTQPIEYRPPYTGPVTIWLQRLAKLALIVVLVGAPVLEKLQREIQDYEQSVAKHAERADSKHLLLNRGFRWISEYPFNR